jgi:hypothetical protein
MRPFSVRDRKSRFSHYYSYVWLLKVVSRILVGGSVGGRSSRLPPLRNLVAVPSKQAQQTNHNQYHEIWQVGQENLFSTPYGRMWKKLCW